MTDVVRRQWEESVDVLGRRFLLVIDGPIPPGRYAITIWEGRRGLGRKPYLKTPIKGRDADEARERTLEVLHTYVGLEQFRRLVAEVAAEMAPGSRAEVTERAREVTVALVGAFGLSAPLVLNRDEILDPATSAEGLRDAVRAHLKAHAVRR